ncbi:MAG: class I tRNA ligase family protein, partial [Bacteroidota bacterium]
MYSRFWTKFLYDMGEVSVEEPFQRLVNQGMIQGTSQMIYRHKESGEYVSADLVGKETQEDYVQIHTDVNIVRNGVMDIEAYKTWTKEANAVFVCNDEGQFTTTSTVEKMSKSKYNTVDPQVICEEYGADTLRLYEMFLGPIEVAKPWNTDGITGVFQFMKRAYNLFYDDQENWIVKDEEATAEELKALHQMLKKVEEGIERLAFNTCVPAFMVFSREMSKAKSHKRAILEPFVAALSPFAPHFAEEMWASFGHSESVLTASFPQWEEKYLVEDTITMPVQINGKVRAKLAIPADASKESVEEIALANATVQQWLDGKAPRKVIVVPGRIINVVV